MMATAWAPLHVESKALLSGLAGPIDRHPDQAQAGPLLPTAISYFPLVETESSRVLVPTSAIPTGAGVVVEGLPKPEIATLYGGSAVSTVVVAGLVYASRHVLDDSQALARIVDTDLRQAVLDALEAQVLEGSGTGGSMTGIWNTAGVPTITATAGGSAAALAEAAGAVIVGGRRRPGLVAIASATYAALLKAAAGSGAEAQALRWLLDASGPFGGLRAVPTPGLTTGRALVGVPETAPVFVERGMTVERGFVNDQFTRNVVTLRGEIFAVVGVSRPAAWANVTGLGLAA